MTPKQEIYKHTGLLAYVDYYKQAQGVHNRETSVMGYSPEVESHLNNAYIVGMWTYGNCAEHILNASGYTVIHMSPRYSSRNNQFYTYAWIRPNNTLQEIIATMSARTEIQRLIAECEIAS